MAKSCPKCKRPNNDRAAKCIYCNEPFPDAPDQEKEKAKEPPEPYKLAITPPANLSPAILEEFCRNTGWDTSRAEQALTRGKPLLLNIEDKNKALSLARELMDMGLECKLERPKSKPKQRPPKSELAEKLDLEGPAAEMVEQLKPQEFIESFMVIVCPAKSSRGFTPEQTQGATGDPSKVGNLKNILKLDRYFLQQKIKSGLPWTVRVFTEISKAQELEQEIKQAGFDAYTMKESGLLRLADKILVTGMSEWTEQEITFTTLTGDSVKLDYDNLFLMVRGRIKTQPDRQQDEDNPVDVSLRSTRSPLRVSLESARSAINPDAGETTEEQQTEDPLAWLIDSMRNAGERALSVKVRAKSRRLRMTIRGHEIHVTDIYLKNSYHAIRIMEDQFDYTGMGEKASNSAMLNYQVIMKDILDHAAEGLIVDDNFKRVSYTLEESNNPDKVRASLMPFSASSGSAKRLFDNKAAFTDYSSRMYLHYLRESKKRKSNV